MSKFKEKDEDLFKEYTSLYLTERRQEAILTGKGPAYKFKSDIEWKELKAGVKKFTQAIRSLVASAIQMIGTIVLTGKGFAEIALISKLLTKDTLDIFSDQIGLPSSYLKAMSSPLLNGTIIKFS